MIRCLDTEQTEYIFSVAVMKDGTGFCSIAGDYDAYQVAGFVTARLNALVARQELTTQASEGDDENIEEIPYG